MGFEDREYAREEGSGFTLGRDWSVVTWIIVVNLGIYVLQILLRKPDVADPVTDFLALRSDLFSKELLTHPWRIAELVTYGFAHSPKDILHIAFNMFMFWMFGRELESRFGGPTFAKMYLTALVIAGLGWLVLDNLFADGRGTIIGASGGVSAVIALFIILFPKRTILFWGIFPMPIWIFGVIWLFGDIRGAVGRTGNVAFTAHLCGAAYGVIFYRTYWTLGKLWPGGLQTKLKRMRGPKLKVHDPEAAEESLGEQVDAILEKIQTQGQDSLTPKEKKILENASRRYQQKHR